MSEGELQHAWRESSLFTKSDDHVIIPVYATFKFIRSNWDRFESGIEIIKTYNQYKKKILNKKYIPDELKHYDKKFFKKYSLFVNVSWANDSGRIPETTTLTKEKKDGKTSLVSTFVV